MSNKKKKGLTLIELVVVIGLTLSISLIAFPILTSRLRSLNLKDTVNSLTSQILQIQQFAYSGKDNTAYGIKFLDDKYILFKGNSYISASQSEIVKLPETIQIAEKILSNGDEFFFEINSFRPNQEANVKLTSETEIYFININSEGIVSTYK